MLGGGIALFSTVLPVRGRADDSKLLLKAEEITGADGDKTGVWGFNGKISDLALTLHKTSALRLANALPAPLRLDLCGLRFPHGPLDATLAPGESRDAPLAVADTGFALVLARDCLGRAKGLVAAIIVPEAPPPVVDADVLAIVWDRPGTDAASPVLLMLSGAPAPATHSYPPSARIRLRLANACAARLASVIVEGAAPTIIAVDSQPSEIFQPLRNQFPLAPLARFEMLFDMPAIGSRVIFSLADLAGGDRRPLLIFETKGDPAPGRGAILALPANSALPAAIALERALRVDVTITGAVGHYALNGARPLFKARQGQPVVLALRNRTDIPQAMRLTGHVGRLLHGLDDGWDPYWRDIVLIAPGKSALLAFVADNKGEWRVESAVAEIAASGVAGVFEVG